MKTVSKLLSMSDRSLDPDSWAGLTRAQATTILYRPLSMFRRERALATRADGHDDLV